MFEKNFDLFPIKREYAFFAHCGVSPLFSKAYRREREIAEEQQNTGGLFFVNQYDEILHNLREAGSKLLNTNPENVAFVKNTSEGMSLIANGYRFNPGDQVIGYTHEYPANYYPWKLQERRGVEYLLLPNRQIEDAVYFSDIPMSWSLADLEERVTKRTKIVAVSHVQFTSGFAADLKELGDFCRSREIDLVVDAAQSLGSLPLYPEEYNISALAASGWKWLLGPIGTGLLFTSGDFREKLDHIIVGAGVMRQGEDYLNHSWDPQLTAKRFEYSTAPISLAAALEISIKDVPLRYGVEGIANEIFRLQDIFVSMLNRDRYWPIILPKRNRSGILSIICREYQPDAVVNALLEEKIVCSTRGGFLRLAPHFYNTDDEVERATSVLNKIML
jgi:selenocysteine lyase/cysteine desulfurase